MLPTRYLGKDGPAITEIGFGAWAIGGPWKFGWGPQDDSDSISAIKAALDSGINWIDTAPAYGLGHSEELVAKAVKGERDRVFIATKCGIVWGADKNITRSMDPGSIEKEIEKSLKRLDTDYIDLYQIHWPDGKTPEDAAWDTMLRLKDSGKIRYAGVSNFNVKKLELCLKRGQIDSLQPPYNLVRRRVEKYELKFCAEHGIGVVAYSPMMSGLLTGRFERSRLASDDWRTGSPYFNEPFLARATRFVSGLKEIASDYGRSVAQLAIAWVLANPAVTSAIVGVRNPGQVEEIAGGAGWALRSEDISRIEKLSEDIFGDQVFSDL